MCCLRSSARSHYSVFRSPPLLAGITVVNRIFHQSHFDWSQPGVNASQPKHVARAVAESALCHRAMASNSGRAAGGRATADETPTEQAQLQAEQQQQAAGEAKIATNKAAIASANKRFGKLADFRNC